MPASLPGSTLAQNLANPGTLGPTVIFDPLSGPKGSPLDVRVISAWGSVKTGTPVYTNDAANQTPSTGALSTGIGIGPNVRLGLTPDLPVLTPIAYSIFRAGYDDDFQPGQRQAYAAPPPPGNTSSNTVDSNRMYIGGGRMIANVGTLAADYGRPFVPSPYTAGVTLLAAGNGGLRDAGAGPAFTGFAMKMVSNTGTVAIANGGTVEGTFLNRAGVALQVAGSTFGVTNAASAAPA
jgi:hypothetical protein